MNKYSSRKFWLAVVAIALLFILSVFNEVDTQMSIVGIYTAYAAGNVLQKKELDK